MPPTRTTSTTATITQRFCERRLGYTTGGVLGLSIAVLRVEDDEVSGLLAVSWSGILLSFQIQRVVRFRDTYCSRQRDFCGVIEVEAGDIRVISIRERFLSLNDFDGVRDSRGEAIT